jgi:heptosyltransferase-2
MKLLIELPTWMGDTVMATPAINNLISQYKSPRITFIGSIVSSELVENYTYVDKVIILDKKKINILKAIRNLGNFDVFISFRTSFFSSLLMFFVHSKIKHQFDKKKYNKGHTVEKYNNFVNECFDFNKPPGKLKLQTKALLKKDSNKKYIGINPGAAYGSAKRWYPEEFAKVAISLAKDYEILILGGPGEENIAADIEKYLIKKNVRNYSNIAAKTSIARLLSEINNLDLLITGDSGPMHIAAAFGVPTVSIFGPTKNDETSQWMNEKSFIVKKNLECQPCMKRTCPLKHHNCMKLIEAKDVLEAIKSLN